MKKIAIIAAVKNECDIIESFCRYNLAYSDCMLIYENYKSSDNTRAIIRKMIDEGLPIFFEGEKDDVYFEWTRAALAKTAIEKYGADLVIPLDADEFLCSKRGGNPREVLENLDEDTEYQIPWRTYVYNGEPDPKDKFEPLNYTHYRNPALEELQGHAGKAIASKYLLSEKCVQFIHGAHWLVYPQEQNEPLVRMEPKVEMSDVLVCAHYPIRGKTQVIGKSVPNWINKWTLPENVRPTRRGDFAKHQLSVIFDEIEEQGDVSADFLREISITYSLYNSGDRTKIKRFLNTLGDEQTISGVIDTAFCADKLKMRYTNGNDNNKIFLQSTLSILDDALQHLDDESRGKTNVIHEMTSEKNQIVAEMTHEKNRLMAEMTNEKNQIINDMTNEKNQIISDMTNEKNQLINDMASEKNEFTEQVMLLIEKHST